MSRISAELVQEEVLAASAHKQRQWQQSQLSLSLSHMSHFTDVAASQQSVVMGNSAQAKVKVHPFNAGMLSEPVHPLNARLHRLKDRQAKGWDATGAPPVLRKKKDLGAISSSPALQRAARDAIQSR